MPQEVLLQPLLLLQIVLLLLAPRSSAFSFVASGSSSVSSKWRGQQQQKGCSRSSTWQLGLQPPGPSTAAAGVAAAAAHEGWGGQPKSKRPDFRSLLQLMGRRRCSRGRLARSPTALNAEEQPQPSASGYVEQQGEVNADELAVVMRMPTIDIKLALQALGVYHRDALEKVDLARRLALAHKYGAPSSAEPSSTASTTTTTGSTSGTGDEDDISVELAMDSRAVMDELSLRSIPFSHLSDKEVLARQLHSARREGRRLARERLRPEDWSTIQLMGKLDEAGEAYDLLARREVLERQFLDSWALQQAEAGRLGEVAPGEGGIVHVAKDGGGRGQQQSYRQQQEAYGQPGDVAQADGWVEWAEQQGLAEVSPSFQSFSAALKWAQRLTFEDVEDELYYRGVSYRPTRDYALLTRLLADAVAVETSLGRKGMAVDGQRGGEGNMEVDGGGGAGLDLGDDADLNNVYDSDEGEDGSRWEDGEGEEEEAIDYVDEGRLGSLSLDALGGKAVGVGATLAVGLLRGLGMAVSQTFPVFGETLSDSSRRVAGAMHHTASNASVSALQGTASSGLKGLVGGAEGVAAWAGGEVLTKEQVLFLTSVFMLVTRRGLWSALALLVAIRAARLSVTDYIIKKKAKRLRDRAAVARAAVEERKKKRKAKSKDGERGGSEGEDEEEKKKKRKKKKGKHSDWSPGHRKAARKNPFF